MATHRASLVAVAASAVYCCSVQTVMSLHTASSVSVAADSRYWVEVHLVIPLHTRFVLGATGGETSYSPSTHTRVSAHSRSEVRVGALVWYSAGNSHVVTVWHSRS